MTPGEARAELARSAGSHFDPTIVHAFLRISVGRLRWLTGPLAWTANFGLVGAVTRLHVSAPVLGVAKTAAALTTAGSLALAPLVATPSTPAAGPLLDRMRPAEVLGEVYERPSVEIALADEVSDAPARPTTTTTRRPAARRAAATKAATPPPSAPPAVRHPVWGAVADTAATAPRKPVWIAVLANDVGAFEPKSVSVLDDGPPVPQATVNAHGDVLFVPGPWPGPTETFAYRVCEAGGRCSTASVTVTVG